MTDNKTTNLIELLELDRVVGGADVVPAAIAPRPTFDIGTMTERDSTRLWRSRPEAR